MRTAAPLFFALLAGAPALAEDAFLQAPVTAATVYPDGAMLSRLGTVSLPAGSHRIFVPMSQIERMDDLPRLALSEGVTLESVAFRPDVAVDPEALHTPAQAEAAAALEAAQDALDARREALRAAGVEVEALDARRAYLTAITPPDDGDVEEILATADLLRREMAATLSALIEARAGLDPLEEAVDEAEAARDRAQAALDRLDPPGETADVVVLGITLSEAQEVSVGFSDLTRRAGWEMDYEIDLDRGSGVIDVARKALLWQETGAPWMGAEITLSTTRPSEALAPTEVYPDLARSYEMVPMPRYSAESSVARLTEGQADMMAAPMVEEAPVAALEVDGLEVSYLYPEPVEIASGEAAELALDRLEIAGTASITASPRYDDTAFLVAEFVNDTGEALLPGMASFSRDGAFTGRAPLPLIPAGAEAELGFGSIEGLRLETTFLRNEEGEGGIINRSNTREQQITFTVENLTDEVQEVRAIYPLTFSEQEDLRVRVTATPAPDETDLDDKRGVSAWDLVVAPGETAEVRIDVSLGWPEGEQLDWRP